MGKVSVSPYCTIEDAKKGLKLDQANMDLVFEWEKKDPPPCDVRVSADWGYRLFINPEEGTTPEEKHKLLAWVVRKSGKKFTKRLRSDSTNPYFWNCNDEILADGRKCLIFVEDMPLGKNCKIVKTKKTFEVSEIVCS